MEAGIGSENCYFFGMGVPDFRERKRAVEWDLNDWKWDGDLFIATPLNSASPPPTLCQSRQLFSSRCGVQEAVISTHCSSSSDELTVGRNGARSDQEKRRRVAVTVNDANIIDKESALALKLSGQDIQFTEVEGGISGETCGKKPKLSGVSSIRALCQVEGCGTDLSNSKDYHRRHKVCEFHSKASKAIVGNVMQRFCQQCSRFHSLQEFDEGKRSCRRRLAGHNKRRRKSHNNAAVTSGSLNDEQTSSYLLISLLRILSNMHNDKPEPTKDQDLLSHLLRSLMSHAGLSQESKASAPLPESQDLQHVASHGSLAFASSLLHNSLKDISASKDNSFGLTSVVAHKEVLSGVVGNEGATTVLTSKSDFQLPKDSNGFYKELRTSTVDRIKTNNFDLNDMYIDSDDSTEVEPSPTPANNGASPSCSAWIHQESNNSSPPQTSGHSDSTSMQSPSSSNGDAQSRTDRIVFKLFGKEPNDIPIDLRAQILDWLSHSPSDIESYIRPGCIILTVYLHLPCTVWEELCFDLSSSLKRLVDVNDNDFWRNGWLYIRVQRQIAFVDSGHVVLDAPLPQLCTSRAQILSVKPIAISTSEKTKFVVKGFNLSRPETRLLCLLGGKCLVQEASCEVKEGTYSENGFQSISFSCSVPVVIGRGFIEVEDYGLGGSFFPFIVAEENMCMEIRTLEGILEDKNEGRDGWAEDKKEAVGFIHEMGWLLQKSGSQSRVRGSDPGWDGFPLARFKRLVEFSLEREWCAVLKKLLDLLFQGTVSSGGDTTTAVMGLSDMNLLHKAAGRKCRPLVEMLLKYAPECDQTDGEMEADGSTGVWHGRFLFRPDAVGPAGLTPLHIAAGKEGCEDVVDALTSDPKTVGMEAWRKARDREGRTPEEYARKRGHGSYIHLVERKRRVGGGGGGGGGGQVVVEIKGEKKGTKMMEVGAGRGRWCSECERRGGRGAPSVVYRPAMLSLVAIAAVCVCVALLFKSRLNVNASLFQWETLSYGTI